MRGELDNVTVAGGSIVLDLVQGSYVPYGCYTSAPIPMPLFDALWPSWNAATPPGTAVETQVRVLVDGNWTAWLAFGKWSLYLKREGAAPRERGPLQLMPDCLLLDSKCATQVQLRIYLYSKNEKATPAVHLLGATVRMVDVIPSGGRPVNRTLHLMPYLQKRRAPVLALWMDLAISLVSLTNRWGADILPEEFAQALRDWRKPRRLRLPQFRLCRRCRRKLGLPRLAVLGWAEHFAGRNAQRLRRGGSPAGYPCRERARPA